MRAALPSKQNPSSMMFLEHTTLERLGLRGTRVRRSRKEPIEVPTQLLVPVIALDILNQFPRFYPQCRGEFSPRPWLRPTLAQLQLRYGRPRNPRALGELHLRERCPLSQLPQASRPKHSHTPTSGILCDYKTEIIQLQGKPDTMEAS